MYLLALSWLLFFSLFLAILHRLVMEITAQFFSLLSLWVSNSDVSLFQGKMCVPHKCVFPGFLLVTVKSM